ncbi:MAG: hypothetical protein A3G33_07315 [Omnitrophica bacterium RIFCSPLOWO2_12_FULL_44_17]|uniref:CinA-like protein n=1 Tax=Candidatus Danuiimicrobium aquiferis TaxID=1801832 RepID=A0A1G1KYN1_9BACT|nr:MAG: hypothetical protein A3B72_07615 [Omnitrophica bacterium RIFCSPHIGHO2_02_FULL_45_28]OGW89236.1 MAG: hypothetical protein A3E74_08290 [Omnitrophica bacterium RIFCSPHIGHO2_12_FULL_44_12]OGW98035.1 MAG: hypothetical protein A3G33_07315 [Omnitrophica bacterium RIFCSPLOWO2_12_FULL_44_17]OGX03521.1 MAG: hypothetical protein A3J12_02915 [Omnitrophica bacterium RIFCSPLOWO2_02_FULL_44_11]
MPHCDIITIGSELLSGFTLNTNAQYLAKQLTDLGFCVIRQASCHDQIEEIGRVIDEALGRSDLIILTGGLGPTPDDVTRQAIAKRFRCDLMFNSEQYRHIVRLYRKIKQRVPSLTKREALFPDIGTPLLNHYGIALGFYIEYNRKLIVVLPGVPRELHGMFKTSVRNLILKKFKKRESFFKLQAKIVGVSEPVVMTKLGKQFFKSRVFDFGIYPVPGEVIIRIKTKNRVLRERLKRELKAIFKENLYTFGDEDFSEAIMKLFVKKKKTLAVAESCTGGWLAKRVTDPSGASRYFLGGVCAYANQIKINFLDIPALIIEKHGAVSSIVAKLMAKGIREECGSSLGVGITGIAGPTGGTPKKPVGLVYVAFSDVKRTKVVRLQIPGERDRVREWSVNKALFGIWTWIKKP